MANIPHCKYTYKNYIRKKMLLTANKKVFLIPHKTLCFRHAML